MAELTTTSAKGWGPDQIAFVPSDLLPEALVLQTSIVAGKIEGDEPRIRVPFINDDTAEFVAEGDEISESDPELSEVLISTGKVSQLVRASREQLAQANATAELQKSIARAVTRTGNSAYLTNPAGSSAGAGLVNAAGIIDGGLVDGDLDALVDLVGEIESNDGLASHIIIDPAGWASLRKLKIQDNSNASLLGAGTMDAERRLLGLPVIVTNAMPTGTGLIVDRTAIVSAVGNVNLASSEHAYFQSDELAVRCTWRLGWNLVRPSRVGKFTVAEDGS